nr:protein ROOT HAIR DEFECTIVE 3-like [Ipomoea trifida]
MVATVRCEEIANEKYASFTANEEWCQLDEAVQSHAVPGFGKKLSSMLDAVIDQANWDSSKPRDKLTTRDIDGHIVVVRASKLAELTTLYEV